MVFPKSPIIASSLLVSQSIHAQLGLKQQGSINRAASFGFVQVQFETKQPLLAPSANGIANNKPKR